ncbi:hypothetical protein CC86DRAFT_415269 [Ophiobolus disseminans]|uniref:Uncharacterized protein n=1 Tax=Ophiobolus disseminans TaxID=1469910 RepID=A0A6A7AJS1_9PLEO|nr:hypothetical protein CC86DRAFT_415269 [Ophiobolus disseminans]
MSFEVPSNSSDKKLVVLPPYQIHTPEYTPGKSVPVQRPELLHANWLRDHEYYNQLGRDPLQIQRVWAISNPVARVEALKGVLIDFPRSKHRRNILIEAAIRGDDAVVQRLVDVGKMKGPGGEEDEDLGLPYGQDPGSGDSFSNRISHGWKPELQSAEAVTRMSRLFERGPEQPHLIEQDDLPSIELVLGFDYPKVRNGTIQDFKFPKSLRGHLPCAAENAAQDDQADKLKWIFSQGIKQHDSVLPNGLPEDQHLDIQHLLEVAAEHGSLNCARLLLEHYGADPGTFRMPRCVTPLYCAAGNEKPDMVQYLLEVHKVHTHISNGRYAAGPTALWIAIHLKAVESIAILLQYGGPVAYINKEMSDVGDRAKREYSEKEGVKDEYLRNMDVNDPRLSMPANPSFSGREESLDKADDLVPEFESAFAAVLSTASVEREKNDDVFLRSGTADETKKRKANAEEDFEVNKRVKDGDMWDCY